MIDKHQSGVLIYDGECPLCLRAVRWLRTSMKPGTIEFLACQDPARPERFPDLSEAQCLAAMQFVLSGGRVLEGPEALPPILRRLHRWHWLARLLEWPVIRQAAPLVYRWVARNRYTLSIIVTRKGSKTGPVCSEDKR